MFHSATFKLTVWYLLIIVAISLMFSIVVYHLAVSELASGLSHQSQRFSDEFPAFSNNRSLRQPSELSSGTHQIISNLVVFNILVLISAGFGSYGLARRTLEPIVQAHEQQKRFTADVSHELRTPLTALRMEAEVALIDKDLSKQGLRGALKSNLEEVDKLELLINNLLKLTKLEADELQRSFTNVALKEITEQATAQTSQMARAKNITLHSEGNDVTVHGDKATLAQLMVILVDNAIKYSPPGSSIEIAHHTDDRHIFVTVTDHGSGIDKASLEHVFERFYRENKARTKSGVDGYGLGLSIAKHIADMHNGSITLSSRVGFGTVATVSLPKIPAAS
ncbi:MAG: HAMP domain-containing sensor histidine kinase [Candidatus Saccharimonadales bacterium]